MVRVWRHQSSVNIVIELLFFSAAKKLWFFLFVCFIVYTKITLHSCDVTSVCCYFINNCIIIILLLTEYFENTEVEGKRRTWNEYSTGNALCTVCSYKGMFLYLLVFFPSLLSLSHSVSMVSLYLRFTGHKRLSHYLTQLTTVFSGTWKGQHIEEVMIFLMWLM